MTLRETLGKKFVFIDQVVDILEIGQKTNKNVFLYGRGGHGKSQIIEEFLKFVDPTGQNSFVQSCGEGLTEEKLFGGMNLAKFQKTGEIEYLVENSFMNKKYVVFEELLDSRLNVLLSLKDILTSGKFRQGKQQFDIKTQMVICLTNRTKQEVSEDDSIKALLERFPLELKVEWDNYTCSEYRSMFLKVLGTDCPRVADICHAINENGDFISPRTAIHMAQVYISTSNIGHLKYFGASSEIIRRMQKKEEERNEAIWLNKMIEHTAVLVGEMGKTPEDVEHYKRHLKVAKSLHNKLSERSYADANFKNFTDLNQQVDSIVRLCKNKIIEILENE